MIKNGFKQVELESITVRDSSKAGRLHAASGSELGHHDCAPGVTAPTQNPLGARHQAAARWRNEEGSGVG